MYDILIEVPGYLDVLPGTLCLGGDSGGGGGGTQTTKSETMKWSDYVPGSTVGIYERNLPLIEATSRQGLSEADKAKYTGDIISKTGSQYAGAQRELAENLGRANVKGGAAAEAMSDLNRSKTFATAGGLANLATTDIEEKRRNLEELRRWIALPNAPVQIGSTTVSTPSGGGGGGWS